MHGSKFKRYKMSQLPSPSLSSALSSDHCYYFLYILLEIMCTYIDIYLLYKFCLFFFAEECHISAVERCILEVVPYQCMENCFILFSATLCCFTINLVSSILIDI